MYKFMMCAVLIGLIFFNMPAIAQGVVVYEPSVQATSDDACCGTCWSTMIARSGYNDIQPGPGAGHVVSMVIQETDKNDFVKSQPDVTLILTAPPGWQFNTASVPAPSLYIKNDGDINLPASQALTVESNRITLLFSTNSNDNKLDAIWFLDLQIKPNTNQPAPPPSTLYITRLSSSTGGGTGVITGITPNTNANIYPPLPGAPPTITSFGNLELDNGTWGYGNFNGIRFSVQPADAIEYATVPGVTAMFPRIQTCDCLGYYTEKGVPTSLQVSVRLPIGEGGRLYGGLSYPAPTVDIGSASLTSFEAAIPDLNVREDPPIPSPVPDPYTAPNNAVGYRHLLASYTYSGTAPPAPGTYNVTSDAFQVFHSTPAAHLKGHDPICGQYTEGIAPTDIIVDVLDAYFHRLGWDGPQNNLPGTYTAQQINIGWDTQTSPYTDVPGASLVTPIPTGIDDNHDGIASISGIHIYIPLEEREKPEQLHFFNLMASVDGAPTITSGAGEIHIECLALPVELGTFTALYRNNTVSLKWTTITESNNFGFDVERTIDGQGWETIGFVRGGGTVNTPSAYSFTDPLDETARRSGVIQYRLRQVDRDGSFEFSPVVTVNLAGVPVTAELYQNFPNPFNPSTNISFSLPAADIVTLVICNALGQEVQRIYDGAAFEAGTYTVPLIVDRRASGIYSCILTTSSRTITRTMSLSK